MVLGLASQILVVVEPTAERLTELINAVAKKATLATPIEVVLVSDSK